MAKLSPKAGVDFGRLGPEFEVTRDMINGVADLAGDVQRLIDVCVFRGTRPLILGRWARKNTRPRSSRLQAASQAGVCQWATFGDSSVRGVFEIPGGETHHGNPPGIRWEVGSRGCGKVIRLLRQQLILAI